MASRESFVSPPPTSEMSSNPYDDLDLLYREIWGTSLHHGLWNTGSESPEEARALLIEELLPLLKLPGTIADIGCGYGDLSLRLARDFGCEVHAWTSSKKQAAALPMHPRLHEHAGDWIHHNLPDESLDRAVAVESLSHFPDFDRFAHRTAAALKDGGLLIVADWFGHDSPLLRHLAAAGDIPPWRTRDDFLKAASDCGLSVIHARNLSCQVAPTWTVFFRTAILLPFRRPGLLGTLLRQACKRPSLLWAAPLIRLCYHNRTLEYHAVVLKKTTRNSSRSHR